MFQSSLLLILVFLPIASTLDYFFMNSYSNAALDDITSLAVNHNATIFVSAYGPQFFLYNNDTTNSYILRHQVPVAGIINSIDITKDGESIALGLNNYQIKLYRYNYTLNTIALNQTISDATDQINSVYFSQDKTLLIAGSKDWKARLYYLLNGQYLLVRVFTLSSAITTVTISSNNTYIYIGDSTGTLRIYKNSTVGYSIFQTINHATVRLNAVSVSNNSIYLTTGDLDGKVRVYRLNAGSAILVSYVLQQILEETTQQIRSMSTSYDGVTLVVSDNIKTIRTYSLNPAGYYQVTLSNLTGLYSKISHNSSIILGSNDKVTNVFKTCSIITNCDKCSSATTCTFCKAGFYANTGVCYGCNANCSTCSVAATTCTGCVDGYFVNSGSVCQVCATGCKACTVSACSSCFDGYYLSATSCVPCLSNCSTCTNAIACLTCATTHFQSYGSCLPCVSPCNRCRNLTYCQGCINNFYLSSPSLCSSCQHPCITCSTNLKCTSCVSGYFFSGAHCQICPPHCLTCTNQSVCTACKPGYLNAYFNGTTCNLCPYNCSTCTSSTNCLTCSDGFYHNAGSCPKCSSHCRTCSSATVCTNCSDTYTLSLGTCIRCPENCTNCNTPTECTSCKKGYFLESTSCVTCSMVGCIYCSTLDSCVLCQGGYSLINNKCVSFESTSDPYGYVREITLTHNQTLSLVITVVLLTVILGAGFGVYCWITKQMDESGLEKQQMTPAEEDRRNKNQNQTGFEVSQMQLSNSLNLP